jgi:transposase
MQKVEKKQQLIWEIQSFWNNLEKQRIKTVAERFQIASPTARKYIEMTEAEIIAMDSPKNYKKRSSPMKRSEVLKYLLTCNPKTKKDKKVEMYIDVIKEKYPIANRIELIFKDFHSTIMGSKVESLDDFLSKYEDSEIKSFCNGIKKDIVPVKNAISSPVSSGFVEGNNNKFKLIKRIVYGRSKLEKLTKKCKLAFLPKDEGFELVNLV